MCSYGSLSCVRVKTEKSSFLRSSRFNYSTLLLQVEYLLSNMSKIRSVLMFAGCGCLPVSCLQAKHLKLKMPQDFPNTVAALECFKIQMFTLGVPNLHFLMKYYKVQKCFKIFRNDDLFVVLGSFPCILKLDTLKTLRSYFASQVKYSQDFILILLQL